MKRIPRSKSTLVAVVGTPLLGTLLLGVLAGCASTTSSSTDSTSSTGTSSSSTSANSTSDTSSSYSDGTYSTNESYQSPGGTEEITVSLTVKSNLITSVKVTTVTSEGEGAQYQAQFESAISSVVVGQNLAGLNLSTVAGASLTSTAFNAAIEAIQSKAA